MNWTIFASVVIGVVTVAGSAYGAVLSSRTARRSNDRTEDNKATEIVAQAHVIAREIEGQALANVRLEMGRLTAEVASMRVELNETKVALHASERNTARAERNVLTLRDLLIARGIPVPDLEGGNG